MKEIYFAGGCFWGTEHYFKLVNGVVETEVGYANGHTENPTYQDVCTDKTGFAETVHIVYDPEVITLEFLTEMYFKAIDPTSVNQQGHDKGTQYRTIMPRTTTRITWTRTPTAIAICHWNCLKWQNAPTDNVHAAYTGKPQTAGISMD